MSSQSTLAADENEPLTCSICLELYDTADHLPKFLECFHTCCFTCLKSYTTLVVPCPLCRQETRIKNGVENMTTNFYIMPSVQKILEKKKMVQEIIMQTNENFAKSVNVRREVLDRLENIKKSLQVMDGLVATRIEDNQEEIAKLQSKLESPVSLENLSVGQVSSVDEFEKELGASKEKMAVALALSRTLTCVEDYSCRISLKNSTDFGNDRSVNMWDEKNLTFDTSSNLGQLVGACQPVFSFILSLMNEHNLWKETVLAGDGDRRLNYPDIATPVDYPQSESSSSTTWSSDSELLSSNYETCYMEFSIDGVVQPEVVFRLYVDEAPSMCQHFLDYCTGEGSLTYESSRIFMTKPNDFFTGGQYEDLHPTGNGQPSAVSTRYVADHSTLRERRGALRMRHRGALRMRHRGRCESGVYVLSEFSILCRDNIRDNQMTTVFGYVIQGMDVCDRISRHRTDFHDIIIESCGKWPIAETR